LGITQSNPYLIHIYQEEKMAKSEIKEKLIQARKLINEACNDADYIENDGLAEDFASLLTNMDGDLEESLRILNEDN